MGTETITAIVALLGLAKLILTEIFEAKKAARIAGEKYVLDKQRFLDISQKALDKMRQDAAKEAGQAQDVEDQVDRRINQ